MANELEQGDEYIESKLPADNNYGQNGYTGASSTKPGEKVSSNFLPQTSTDGLLDRTRSNVQAAPGRLDGPKSAAIPVKEGHRRRNITDAVSIGSTPVRPVKK
jgi:hypothetical protein